MEVSNTLTEQKSGLGKFFSRFAENTGKKLKKGEKKAEKQEAAARTPNEDMKQYSRAQLLEVILLQSRENDNLKSEIKKLRGELSDKLLKMNKAGNIADAALALNDVFRAAEEAVSQYKENIRRLSEDKEAVAGGIIKEAEEKAKSILNDAETKAKERIAEAERSANAIVAQAQVSAARSKMDADKYWEDISAKLENAYNKGGNPEGQQA